MNDITIQINNKAIMVASGILYAGMHYLYASMAQKPYLNNLKDLNNEKQEYYKNRTAQFNRLQNHFEALLLHQFIQNLIFGPELKLLTLVLYPLKLFFNVTKKSAIGYIPKHDRGDTKAENECKLLEKNVTKNWTLILAIVIIVTIMSVTSPNVRQSAISVINSLTELWNN